MSLRDVLKPLAGAQIGAIAAGLALALLAASPLAAQTLSNSFGGLSENSDEPIDIESDVLTVYDAKKYATFKGNVKAVQGTTTLRAAELDVHYVGGSEKLTGQSPAPAPVPVANGAKGAVGDGQTQISKIEARGDVVIVSEDDQTTSSDWALYDVPSQIVTVGGNVVLTQGQNVLKGDRLIIDLKTGESRFENTSNTTAGGRIRALFMPKEKGGQSAAEPNGEPGAPSPAGNKESEPGRGAQPPGDGGMSADDAEPLPIVPEYR